MGPRVHATREIVTPAAVTVRDAASRGWKSTSSALGPLAGAALEGARQAGDAALKAKARSVKSQAKAQTRGKGRRWSVLAGLLAAGTAVGAAGALVMRRRKQQEWDEYDPSRALRSPEQGSVADRAAGKAEDAMDKAASATESTLDSTSESAQAAAGKVQSAAEKAAGKTSAATGEAKERTSAATEKAKAETSRAAERGDEFVSKTGSPSKNSRS